MGFALVGKQGDVSVLRRRDYGAEVLALLLKAAFLVSDCEHR
jgi:hypothetical protein